MLHFVHDNLHDVQGVALTGPALAVVERYAQWVQQQEAQWLLLMAQRLRQGHIREVHGDLHLENLCVFEGRITLFDCVEFDPRLRRIDVMDDLSFLIMDLRARGAHRLARRVLNRYLEATGDYEGLPLLRYCMAYRAMVRVKVAHLTNAQVAHAQHYLDLVGELMNGHPCALLITHGLSGSGKSTLSQTLIETMVDAVRVRSDALRRRLPDSDRYEESSTQGTYERLVSLAEGILRAGYVAVVDATFLKRQHRDLFKALAARCGVPFRILQCQAQGAVLRERIIGRQAAGQDASEATLEVLAIQERRLQVLGADELPMTWLCPNGVMPEQVLSTMQALLRTLVADPHPGRSGGVKPEVQHQLKNF
jgi:predicted kinase